MTQNRSTAVMQRRVEPHDSLDDFPTPPWATRALCEWIKARSQPPMNCLSCREPAANRGHMVLPLREYFDIVFASDIHDYGVGFPQADYLFGPDQLETDWTITNPPFRLAEQFIARTLRISKRGVAVIVRSAFTEGVGRYRDIFSISPPTDILQFSERVSMHKGKLAGPRGSTATAYCWMIWRKGPAIPAGTSYDWIAPCRAKLELPEDYAAGGNGLIKATGQEVLF